MVDFYFSFGRPVSIAFRSHFDIQPKKKNMQRETHTHTHKQSDTKRKRKNNIECGIPKKQKRKKQNERKCSKYISSGSFINALWRVELTSSSLFCYTQTYCWPLVAWRVHSIHHFGLSSCRSQNEIYIYIYTFTIFQRVCLFVSRKMRVEWIPFSWRRNTHYIFDIRACEKWAHNMLWHRRRSTGAELGHEIPAK